VNVVISDFDDTLFKRNVGLITRTVDYLEQLNYPVYIVTFRAEDQLEFIESVLAHSGLQIAGYGFAGSRKKEPAKKLAVIRDIATRHNIVEVLDDDHEVVLQLVQAGFPAHHVSQI